MLLGLIGLISLDTGPEGIYGLPAAEYAPMVMIAIAQVALLLAFRWEKWGGAVALAAALAIPFAYWLTHDHGSGALLTATLLWGAPAVLYLLVWLRGRKRLLS